MPNITLEATGHSAGFFPVWAVNGCGPRLSLVRLGSGWLWPFDARKLAMEWDRELIESLVKTIGTRSPAS
jgi:hypothetical protein